MTENHPTLAELVGDDLEPREQARLERVHSLLCAVEAPPTDVPALVWPEPAGLRPRARRRPWPRGLRLLPRLSLAGAALAAACVAGFWLGHPAGEQEAYRLSFQSSAALPAAQAALEVVAPDRAGNHRLVLRVAGLPRERTYALWLVRPSGRWLCGRFRTGSGTTTVEMTVPYGLQGHPAWTITSSAQARPLLVTRL